MSCLNQNNPAVKHIEGNEGMVNKVFVCLEIGDGGTGAFVPEYPGCWVFGHTPRSALRKVKVAVDEWCKWMEKHGERISSASGFEVEIAEMLRVNYNPVEAGKPEPLFWSETLPVSKKDVTRTIRLMEYSRKDLLDLVSNLNYGCLVWHPKNKPRSIENCLRHIAYVEPWYITRLNVDLPCRYPRNVFKMLDYTRDIVIDFLRDFPREKMKGIFQPEKDPSPVCNLWTARKVLRRLVDHERLHTKYIEKLLQIYAKNTKKAKENLQ